MVKAVRTARFAPWSVPSHLPTAEALDQLLELEDVESITVEVHGGGPLDGSDLCTQVMIKAIAKVVSRLVIEFGEHFRLTRVRREPNGQMKDRDLTSY